LNKKTNSKRENIQRGSDSSTPEPRFLIIGRVIKPHGIRGEVRVQIITDTPERFEWLETVYVGERHPQLITIEPVRFHKTFVLIKFAGIDTREGAVSLRNELLLVPESEAVPLEEGEYYLYQLIGLDVYTDEGEQLGELAEVLETNANNVFVVKGDRGEVLLPDTEEVIINIDFENGRMEVHLLPGLI
jgi:16S rRNA processing protein RimM